MLRKNNYHNYVNTNKGISNNISKIKYFLPSSNLSSARGQRQQKQLITCMNINHNNIKTNKQNSQNPLLKLRQKLSKKYSSLSTSSSKIHTKRSQSKKNNFVRNGKDNYNNYNQEDEREINQKVGCDNFNNNNNDESFQIIGIRDVERNNMSRSIDICNNNNSNNNNNNSKSSKSNKKFNYYLCEKQQQQNQSNCYKLNLTQFHNQHNNKTMEYQNPPISSSSYNFSSLPIQNSVRQLSKSIQLSSQLCNSSQNNFTFLSILKRMTQSSKQQKKQFQQFLLQLKNDQNYQNVISMFTVMYFYEKKKENNVNDNKKMGIRIENENQMRKVSKNFSD